MQISRILNSKIPNMVQASLKLTLAGFRSSGVQDFRIPGFRDFRFQFSDFRFQMSCVEAAHNAVHSSPAPALASHTSTADTVAIRRSGTMSMFSLPHAELQARICRGHLDCSPAGRLLEKATLPASLDGLHVFQIVLRSLM